MALNPTQDPSETDPADAAEDDMSAGYCIELCVKPDGTMTIEVEPLKEEMMEEDPEGKEPDGTTPVSSKADALKMISSIIDNNGEMADSDDTSAFNQAHADQLKQMMPPTMGKKGSY